MRLLRKYRAIAYLPNVYTLLQYYLLEPYRVEDTLFFFDDNFPSPVIERIPGAKILSRRSKVACCISLYIIRSIALFYRTMPIYLGGDLCYTNSFLRFFKRIIYLEDGSASYLLTDKEQPLQKNKTILKRWLWGKIYPSFGLANNVELVFLTGILPIPEIIVKKVRQINLELLWQQKDERGKEWILNIFMPNGFDPKLLKRYDILLLTQPITEQSEGYFSESEKIKVYRLLLKDYNESNVLIKVHPTEVTDYSLYFPSAGILTGVCPMELLSFLGIAFKKTITVNSTAIFNMKETGEKIIAGWDVTAELAGEAKRRRIYNWKS